MSMDPKPGDRLADADFEQVVRLTPLISIDIIVRVPDGRVLLGRRKNEPAKGTLFVPGGRITKNETVEAAFRRITRAELGSQKELSQARFLGIYDHIYETNVFGKRGFGTHYVVQAYALELKEELHHLPPEQHGSYVWLTAPQILASPQVHKNTKAYFKQHGNTPGIG
jgi:colanic acid biosynthesis protein WcaH